MDCFYLDRKEDSDLYYRNLRVAAKSSNYCREFYEWNSVKNNIVKSTCIMGVNSGLKAGRLTLEEMSIFCTSDFTQCIRYKERVKIEKQEK
jgi:hypothetical protein